MPAVQRRPQPRPEAHRDPRAPRGLSFVGRAGDTGLRRHQGGGCNTRRSHNERILPTSKFEFQVKYDEDGEDSEVHERETYGKGGKGKKSIFSKMKSLLTPEEKDAALELGTTGASTVDTASDLIETSDFTQDTSPVSTSPEASVVTITGEDEI